jgi:imidazole glycerol phosphate synthase subunit HisF
MIAKRIIPLFLLDGQRLVKGTRFSAPFKDVGAPLSQGMIQDAQGAEEIIIVDINAYMPNCQDPAKAHFTHLEDVAFTYRKITWTHEVGGTEGSDDWRAPKA